MNIVTFGCSHTYGWCLGNDCSGGANDPSPLAWPQKLADLYGCTVNNLGEGGNSNKIIVHKILQYNYKPDDVVFVCWSNMDRWAVIEEEVTHNIGVWDLDGKGTDKEQYEIAKHFFERIHSPYDMKLEFYRSCMLANLFLQDIGVKNFHTSVLWDQPKKNSLKTNQWFDYKRWLMPDWQFHKDMHAWPLADDNMHPGPGAHEALAKRFYDYSKEQLL
mgnify:CR=1 FL=1|jgi:hypothetical protein|tara:strand:- start:324 stop:974 length:651 start_codon:yes stop_codon:yes gene_type:complete